MANLVHSASIGTISPDGTCFKRSSHDTYRLPSSIAYRTQFSIVSGSMWVSLAFGIAQPMSSRWPGFRLSRTRVVSQIVTQSHDSVCVHPACSLKYLSFQYSSTIHSFLLSIVSL